MSSRTGNLSGWEYDLAKTCLESVLSIKLNRKFTQTNENMHPTKRPLHQAGLEVINNVLIKHPQIVPQIVPSSQPVPRDIWRLKNL